MTDERPFSDINWRYTMSGKRKVVQSSPIFSDCDASRIAGWLIGCLNANIVHEKLGLREPYEASEIDDTTRPGSQVYIIKLHGNRGPYTVEVRELTPEQFTAITGAPVINELQAGHSQQKKIWADTAVAAAKRPPCQGI